MGPVWLTKRFKAAARAEIERGNRAPARPCRGFLFLGTLLSGTHFARVASVSKDVVFERLNKLVLSESVWRICHGCLGKDPLVGNCSGRSEKPLPASDFGALRGSSAYGGFVMQRMKFVVATVSLLVLVSIMGGTIVVVAGVLTPKVITAGVD